MSIAIVFSRARVGVQAPLVTVETHLSNGLPGFSIVGLPETAVKESRDRVRSALINAYFEFPNRRITVNLAPADLPKEGGRFDLPIALGILVASGQLPPETIEGMEFIGELALTGAVRSVGATLPSAMAAARAGRSLVVPAADGGEAALAGATAIYAPDHLLTLTAHLLGRERLAAAAPTEPSDTAQCPDLSDVRGQQQARRALEITAAGAHNLLLFGPPGTGKTMLASRLPGILPPMTTAEALEAAAVHSVSHAGFDIRGWGRRPFRTPHHTASAAALIGGGSNPSPGEVSLAHHGVLFLDEFPEFQRKVLEVMREPLESGAVVIARASSRVRYPAAFQLVAAMNPCPCGYHGDQRRACRCTPDQIRRYRERISGPLLDRIDLHVPVMPVAPALLGTGPDTDSDSATVRRRVTMARERQLARNGGVANRALAGDALVSACGVDDADRDFLFRAIEQLELSARAYHRILRVARTIADLDGDERVVRRHIAEAISLRALDREVR